ncbi:MAG: class I SAM-dependent methyltransferase [Bacillota bacterium]|nr:class I SAM-dependent methyltransferase [Bacillota bacterium]
MGDIQFKQLKDSLFWERAWYKDRENSFFRRGRKTLQDTVDFWNKRADIFQKNVMGQKGDKRVKRVLDWLEMQGVELAGKEVLDIGAGPGAFSLALAQRCRAVVALEPAEVMVKFLKSEVASSGCSNVRVIQNTWEEVDLKEEDLFGRFDLVFASMSPGINNLDTIQKALDCSKEYFYYSSFAGLRESDLLKKLWPILYGENFPDWPDQVIFVLNLLYTLDLQINFEVWEERNRVELTMHEAVNNLLDEQRNYGKEPPYAEEKLQDFVLANMKDGVLLQQNRTRLGQILARKT